MRLPTRRLGSRTFRRAALVATVLLSAGSLNACATLRATFGGYAQGPDGIARSQHRLREALASGDFRTALGWHEDDALLAMLTGATSAYYAAQYQRAAALLDTAALLADDRVTASLSRDALALVTNDNARPYQPRTTERLFIAYYGMLSYARLESWEEAAVEARRMVGLLAQRDDDRDPQERALHAAMEHLAGVVLERAGRAEEALVAYRVAHRMLDSAPERPAPPAAGQGEVLVVLERGFVAHRVNEQINIFFGGPDDDDSLHTGRHRRRHPAERLAHQLEHMDAPARGPYEPSAERSAAIDSTRAGRGEGDDDDDGYWLAVAFSALRRSTRPWGETVQLQADGVASDALHLDGVVDDAASVDERRDRAAMLARAAARASAKYAVARAVKEKKGKTAGTLANFGVSLLERADVRSWHLLPQEVRLFRVTLPAGAHTLHLQVGDGARTRLVEIGAVVVRSGAMTIVPKRIWRDEEPVPLLAAR